MKKIILFSYVMIAIIVGLMLVSAFSPDDWYVKKSGQLYHIYHKHFSISKDDAEGEKIKKQEILDSLQNYSEECQVHYDVCVQEYCPDIQIEGEFCWEECELMVQECENNAQMHIDKLTEEIWVLNQV